MSSLLLASGGLDSTTLAYWLRERGIDFVPVFIDYGQHCVDTEHSTLLKVLPAGYGDRVKTLHIADIYRGSRSRLIDEPNLWTDNVQYEELYLPYRNLLLLTVAAAHAQTMGFDSVYAGFINSNHAKELDCSAEFFAKLFRLLDEYGSVEIRMPFRTMTKYEVALEGIRLRAPIAHTFSCQVSSVVPCGACPNCVDRLDALRQLGPDLSTPDDAPSA